MFVTVCVGERVWVHVDLCGCVFARVLVVGWVEACVDLWVHSLHTREGGMVATIGTAVL